MKEDRDLELKGGLYIAHFIHESNEIEGIVRPVTNEEADLYSAFLVLPVLTVADVENFVQQAAGAPLREKLGMDVQVGSHLPPPGGPAIRLGLEGVLNRACGGRRDPHDVHIEYEHLHPFMDGNGRSGRIIWLWMHRRAGTHAGPLKRGFRTWWYYESLEYARR